MLFKDLQRLAPGCGGGYIPVETLRKLRLPMPEGVFRQLVIDHALTPFTVHCYGDLDLHGLEWKPVRLTAGEIAGSAVHKDGADLVLTKSRHASAFAVEGWDVMTLTEDDIALWLEHRTWLEFPLFVEGSIVGSAAALQLIEGHCRLGTLRGLLNCGWLPADGAHSVWLGRRKQPQ